MAPDPAPTPDFTALVTDLARAGRAAQRQLARMSDGAKAAALCAAAASLRAAAAGVLAANARDLAAGAANGLTPALLDRLKLDEGRLEAIAGAIEQVAALPDPVGQVIDRSTATAGMELVRRRIPIGLIGIIYESRPNVTADAAALCLRAGNAVLLRGGSEAVHSNRAIHAALVEGLVASGCARCGGAADADAGPRGGGRDAERGRADRHDRAARRQEPGRTGAARCAGAGARPS